MSFGNDVSRQISDNENEMNNSKRLALLASTVVFELNKASLKIRRSLRLSSIRNKSFEKSDINKSNLLSPTNNDARFSSGGSTRVSKSRQKNRQLCAQLSSFALYPVRGILSPNCYSSPNLFYNYEKMIKTKLLDLSDDLLLRIMSTMAADDLKSFANTCSRLRAIALKHEDALPKRNVRSHEIIISYNNRKKTTEVRLLKLDRTRDDESFYGLPTISAALAPFSRAVTKITFTNNTYVTDWTDEILDLHKKRKLCPTKISFTGGSLTNGNHMRGADMRFLSEFEFVSFVSKLAPDLEEVQVATSRIFKINKHSKFLYTLITQLSVVGIVYEKPPLRYHFEDAVRTVSHWKNNEMSKSCDVYIRRPIDSTIDKWNSIGTVEEYRTDENDEQLVLRATINHSFLVNITLTFHFH